MSKGSPAPSRIHQSWPGIRPCTGGSSNACRADKARFSATMRLVECVPNFSEGRRPEIVKKITDAIAAVDGVTVLDVSSDTSHNRTVVTFVAPIEKAVDAAFAGMKTAQSVIDLTKHSGEHPRMGATDVVPFIPLEGTTMEDCIVLARTLGERVGKELGIPVFL